MSVGRSEWQGEEAGGSMQVICDVDARALAGCDPALLSPYDEGVRQPQKCVIPVKRADWRGVGYV